MEVCFALVPFLVGGKRRAVEEPSDDEGHAGGWPHGSPGGEDACETRRPAKRRIVGWRQDSPEAAPTIPGTDVSAPVSAFAGYAAQSEASSSTCAFGAQSATAAPDSPQVGSALTGRGSDVVSDAQAPGCIGDLQRQMSLPDLRALGNGLPESNWHQGTQREVGDAHTPYFSNEGAYLF